MTGRRQRCVCMQQSTQRHAWERTEKKQRESARQERAQSQRLPKAICTHVRSTGTAAACASVRAKLTCTVADEADMAGRVCDCVGSSVQARCGAAAANRSPAKQNPELILQAKKFKPLLSASCTRLLAPIILLGSALCVFRPTSNHGVCRCAVGMGLHSKEPEYARHWCVLFLHSRLLVFFVKKRERKNREFSTEDARILSSAAFSTRADLIDSSDHSAFRLLRPP